MWQVRKSYEEKRRRRTGQGQGRAWKLKRMAMDIDDGMQLKKGQQLQADKRQQDLERFMQVKHHMHDLHRMHHMHPATHASCITCILHHMHLASRVSCITCITELVRNPPARRSTLPNLPHQIMNVVYNAHPVGAQVVCLCLSGKVTTCWHYIHDCEGQFGTKGPAQGHRTRLMGVVWCLLVLTRLAHAGPACH